MRRSVVCALLLVAGACSTEAVSDGGEGAEKPDAATADAAGASDAGSTDTGTQDVDVEDAQRDAGVDAFDAYVPPTYTVGGTLSGLTKGKIVLQNNAGDDVSLVADAPFTFAKKALNGAPYDVTIRLQPAQQSCTVANGSGTVAGANVSVAVSCVPKPEELYVVNQAMTDIVAYDPLAAYGDPPKRIVTSCVGAFAFDDNEMFVACGPQPGIAVFDPSGTNAVARRRIVDPKATGRVSAGGGEVFTGTSTEIRAWNASDNGVVAPKRTLTVASKGDYFAVSDGEIYTVRAGVVGMAYIYPQNAAGNDPPWRSISIKSTCAGHTVGPVPLAVYGDDLVVTCIDGHIGISVGIFDKRTGLLKARLGAGSTPGRCARSSTFGTFCESGTSADIFVFPGLNSTYSRKMIGFDPALY